MPVSYQYLDANGTPVPLVTIDKLLCEAQGITEDPKRYCGFFQLLMWVGMGVAQRSSNWSTCDETGFQQYLKENPATFTDPKEHDLAKRFLCGEYHYKCWR